MSDEYLVRALKLWVVVMLSATCVLTLAFAADTARHLLFR